MAKFSSIRGFNICVRYGDGVRCLREGLGAPLSGEGEEPGAHVSGGVKRVAAVVPVRHAEDRDHQTDAQGDHTLGRFHVMLVRDRHDAHQEEKGAESLEKYHALSNIALI